MAITTIQLICEKCGKYFDRSKSEHDRNTRKGRKVFCSNKCSGNINKIPPEKSNRDASYLNPANRQDEYSPFRFHLRNAKRRIKKECDLTLAYLKELWEEQEGKCPFTGWSLKNMPNLTRENQLPLTPDRASLDRKDPSKGYTQGNVQFVSVMAQYAKHIWSDPELRCFCEAVVIHSNA